MDGKGMNSFNIIWFCNFLVVNLILNLLFIILDFTLSYLQKYGFITPLLFKDKTGLGLHVPSQNFSVNDVRTCVGKCITNIQYLIIKYFFIFKT